MSATVLVAGCATGTATVTGMLDGADGACLYVRVPAGNGTEAYWLRQLPSGYEAVDRGIRTPDGGLIGMGDSLTVSGALSLALRDSSCDGGHTLDATAIR